MKQIHVQYFGALREVFGTTHETTRSAAQDCEGLWAELCTAHGLQLHTEGLRVAVDDAFAHWTTVLVDDCTVAFMPPFAGG
jgi:molybdopterin synthase sulfur carrier subunit